ncbi:glycosyltransferase family 4 protein [Corynebacterium uberis]|uniref:glycosyltransferase family 4 protein n=1 Tax=Corynebacterium TaxID=1716 RepID=UPI001D0B337E|nr:MULTISPECIES: glycosyltransferase family 4 protein [Corynebacterium]MCZ9309622.1 glycosyltransferase family 4 protein [Corynebacterium sp. c6VSa_13]UDL73428.1 glycosyltransferase family 4 protein [Corynebacterium uberis]UDL75692.1 glycosyltransferase family 4 protein [Corynebacterium uberis]UDL77905.1 glycosyltransferase family 4 protein [Corynebacterium uberis]UDL80188.1 glycosyltransferase family 4 protein [Corynebacterium uberis]
MKILLLCWRDTHHPQGGGSERYLERVGAYLAGRGHEVVYRTAAYPGARRWDPATPATGGVAFSRGGGKLTVYPRAWLAMLAGRLGVGPLRGVDVVVDTQNGVPFFARLWAGAPVVVLTHHCHREQWPVAGPVLSRVGWWCESWLSPRVHRRSRWVTVSASSARELTGLGVAADRISIIRNGVDPVPAAVTAASDPAPTSPAHLITLSRLVPHKRIEQAMDVVAQLPGVVLDVVGSGWWEDRLRSYARRRGVADRVVFHGQVDEATKHALLARAAVHVMPSRKEGWGLAVVEAAQHGVPTVGYYSSGGLRDSVVDGVTGLLVDTPEQLAAQVSRLLIDAPLRHRLGRAARSRAASYSWRDTGAAWEDLLSARVRAR